MRHLATSCLLLPLLACVEVASTDSATVSQVAPEGLDRPSASASSPFQPTLDGTFLARTRLGLRADTSSAATTTLGTTPETPAWSTSRAPGQLRARGGVRVPVRRRGVRRRLSDRRHRVSRPTCRCAPACCGALADAAADRVARLRHHLGGGGLVPDPRRHRAGTVSLRG